MTTLVHHHIKYKEIHGEDVVILMDKSEHAKLHRKLRKEGKCNIPSNDLHKISVKAFGRRKDYSAQWRYYKSHPEASDQKRIRMRIYNTYHGGYSLVPRLRPDVLSAAFKPPGPQTQ